MLMNTTYLKCETAAEVLKDDPLRCQSLPNMTLAGWDLLELIMISKSEDYPDLFELHRNGNNWRWINKPMQIDHSFTFLDDAITSLWSDGIYYKTNTG